MLAVTLVVGAGLLIRSFVNLTRVDMGFNRSELTTFGVVLPGASYNAQRRVAFYDQLGTKLRGLPGVKSVAAMSGLPPLRNVNANDTDFQHIPDNRPPGTPPIQNVDFWQFVSSGYTETMGDPGDAGPDLRVGRHRRRRRSCSSTNRSRRSSSPTAARSVARSNQGLTTSCRGSRSSAS